MKQPDKALAEQVANFNPADPPKILDGVNAFRKRFGDRYWRPAALLEESAAEGNWLK